MSETDTPGLKACGHCGGQAYPQEHFWAAVVCSNCAAEGPAADTPDEAIAAWNRRAPDERDATIARLREAIELVWRKAATMRNANKLVGPYPNDPAKTKLWAKALYHEGKDLQKMLQPYRAALETGK